MSASMVLETRPSDLTCPIMTAADAQEDESSTIREEASGYSDTDEEVEEEAAYRMGLRETYLLPLSPVPDDEEATDDTTSAAVQRWDADQLLSFVDTFDIEAKTDEIAELLLKYDVLQMIFTELVPVQVSYTSFWERYFYRCDTMRIRQLWELEHELNQKALRARFLAVEEIVALPGRLVHGVVVQPVSFLARKLVSSLSVVSAIAGLQTTSKHHPDGPLQELPQPQQAVEELQLEMTESNETIACLRKNLDIARQELALTELTTQSLAAELAATRAALFGTAKHHLATGSTIQEITIRDDTSNTVSSTDGSGLEESSSRTEEATPVVETSLRNNSSKAAHPSTVDEYEPTEEEDDDDDLYYDADHVLLMM